MDSPAPLLPSFGAFFVCILKLRKDFVRHYKVYDANMGMHVIVFEHVKKHAKGDSFLLGRLDMYTSFCRQYNLYYEGNWSVRLESHDVLTNLATQCPKLTLERNYHYIQFTNSQNPLVFFWQEKR
ncbi:hypothetical protein ACFX2A_024009 [Malus domestica]